MIEINVNKTEDSSEKALFENETENTKPSDDGVNWDEIAEKLPTKNTKDDKEKRKQMFRDFDPNGNGVLSLAECDKAMRDVLAIDNLFDAKPAIMRAFQIAKDSKPSTRVNLGDDYIELKEFKFFLLSLRQYFEYYVAFVRVDENSDKRISLDEFKSAQDKIESWVGKIDAEVEFSKIDSNGGGFILFDEFCKWAIKKNLDLEDDDDFETPTNSEVNGTNNEAIPSNQLKEDLGQ